MKNTYIVTMEVTVIGDFENVEADKEGLKEALYADDVVITKIQKFEGTDGNHE